jgi:hypothetical protein
VWLPIVIGVLALIALHTGLEWQRRRRELARIRRNWGRPRRETPDVSSIASYHRAVTAAHPEDSLDERTWQDLDLDLVFATIDRTESSVGQQRLYHRLRSFASVDTIDAFEALVDRLTHDRLQRERCQVALSRLRDASGYQVWSLAQPGWLVMRRWHVVFPLAAMAMATLLAMSLMWPGLILLLAVAGPLLLFVRAASARRLGRLIDAFRYVGPLIATAAALRPLVHADNEVLTAALRDQAGALTTLRVLSGWLTRDSVAMDPLTGTVIELVNTLFLLDANMLLCGALLLNQRGRALEQVVAAVGEIDAAIAVASYRAALDQWTRPVFRELGSPIAIGDVRHPLLPGAVPNSIDLAPPHGVLITGSNMSGKSTFLRSIGLTAVLAQTIHTCTAARYEAPPLRVRSCIGRGDNLLEGKSYYLDEVEAVVGVVRASQSERMHLFLFDELFRGTNAVERIAASEATLHELSTTAHVVIAATHDLELVDLLHGAYAPFHFIDRIEAGALVFDYRLRSGVSRARNAIALLELNGAPPTLVARARARAERLTVDERLPTTPDATS